MEKVKLKIAKWFHDQWQSVLERFSIPRASSSQDRALWLASKLHSVPHVDLRVNMIDSRFRYTREYLLSLMLIAILPMVVLLAYPLLVSELVLFWRLFIKKNNIRKKRCSCKREFYMYLVHISVLVLLGLALLCEAGVVLAALDAHQSYVITDESFFGEGSIKDISKALKQFDPAPIFIKLRTQFPNVTLEQIAQPARMFARFLTRIQQFEMRVRTPMMKPRGVTSGFRMMLMVFVWKRLAVCLLFWLSGLFICSLDPHKNWRRALFAVVWCAFANIVMACMAVGLADFCQYSSFYVQPYVNKEVMLPRIHEMMNESCDLFHKMYDFNKRALMRQYLEWHTDFIEMSVKTKTDIEYKYEPWNSKKWFTDEPAVFVAQDMLAYLEKCITINLTSLTLPPCPDFEQTVTVKDIPSENVDPWCHSSGVIRWLVYQWIAVILSGVLSAALVYMHLWHVRNYKGYFGLEEKLAPVEKCLAGYKKCWIEQWETVCNCFIDTAVRRYYRNKHGGGGRGGASGGGDARAGGGGGGGGGGGVRIRDTDVELDKKRR